ncbi:MAG: hypothetical protein ACE5FT_01895 [Candidatus Nanoarchaeia archaeon]
MQATAYMNNEEYGKAMYEAFERIPRLSVFQQPASNFAAHILEGALRHYESGTHEEYFASSDFHSLDSLRGIGEILEGVAKGAQEVLANNNTELLEDVIEKLRSGYFTKTRLNYSPRSTDG